jgi:hypothetical protein
MIEEMLFPETFPPCVQVFGVRDRCVWVQVYPPPGRGAECWQVLAASGGWLASMTLPVGSPFTMSVRMRW